MTLKALLLGSAAAMIAVSGAQAADAVTAEPEATDYVRVCDTYGAGFFYIPGTETCMKIGGYVRVDYTYNDVDPDATSTWEYRARLNFDVRNETDYGQLRSQIRLQADSDGGNSDNARLADGDDDVKRILAGALPDDGDVRLDRALISLGGFRLGYSDSFTTTHHGYGLPVEKYDGPYRFDQAMMLDYTFASNGFSVTLGVQDSVGDSGGLGNNDHVDPEYYVGLGYSNATFSLAASYLHEDESGKGTYKISGSVKPVDGLTLNGWYLGGESATRVLNGSDYTYGVGLSYAATDTLSFGLGYSDDEGDESAITVGATWDAAPGLSIRPNFQFREDTGESYSVRVYRTF